MSEPIECVGVVCVRLHDDPARDAALLIRRANPPRAGEWSIPGGRIEPGEAERDAALRELSEETGVAARLRAKLCTLEPVFEGRAYRLHDWWAEWVSGEPEAGDDAQAARFVTLAEARGLGMWPATLAVVEDALHRARAALVSRP